MELLGSPVRSKTNFFLSALGLWQGTDMGALIKPCREFLAKTHSRCSKQAPRLPLQTNKAQQHLIVGVSDLDMRFKSGYGIPFSK
jgi:hypothetical protein